MPDIAKSVTEEPKGKKPSLLRHLLVAVPLGLIMVTIISLTVAPFEIGNIMVIPGQVASHVLNNLAPTGFLVILVVALSVWIWSLRMNEYNSKWGVLAEGVFESARGIPGSFFHTPVTEIQFKDGKTVFIDGFKDILVLRGSKIRVLRRSPNKDYRVESAEESTSAEEYQL